MSIQQREPENIVPYPWIEERSSSSLLVVSSRWSGVLSEVRSAIRRSGDALSEAPGRGAVERVLIDGKPVIRRRCLRGGFVGRFVTERWFLNLSKLKRPVHEVIVLDYLWRNGIGVAEPVCAFVDLAARGALYSGCVLTAEVEGGENLLELAKRRDPRTPAISLSAGREARRVVHRDIFHSDLHPGNVLSTPTGVCLIDFDKSYRFSESAREVMKARLANRWMRSAEKHERRELLQPFLEGLFDES